MNQDTVRLFNQARTELYSPPCRLALGREEEEAVSSIPLSVLNGVVSVGRPRVPRVYDPQQFLLWHFRHELAHVHHCPYDIKTAYSLERSAHEIVGRWDIAYLAAYVFSDLQVNLNYLPGRFHQVPHTIQARGRRPRGLDRILFEVYRHALSKAGSPPKGDIQEAAREIYTIIRSNKPWQWQVKAQMIAIILERLRARNPGLFSEKRTGRYIKGHPMPVREDYYPNSVRMFEETYGAIPDQGEARRFFEHWIEPRIPSKEKQDLKETLKREIKARQGREEDEGVEAGRGRRPKVEMKPEDVRPSRARELPGGEPRLPTSLSRLYRKIDNQVLDEAFWRRYWYRSRAERTIISYLADSPSRRPMWSVTRYPDEWYIEDEIEALDVEMSLDEGSLIPEVNTLQWVQEPTSQGQSVISGFVPSAVIVLDASLSMAQTHDAAATAAFIAHLSAHRAGGQTSTVTFSTGYASAGWNDPEEIKELVLSTAFDEFTVFPAYEIARLTSNAGGECFVVVITDGGWQNIDEAIPLIGRIADRGHRVFIFQLPGGEYPERMERISQSPDVRVFRTERPERDLQGLVLATTMKTYQTFLT